jgi:hypothetical protein
MRRMTKIVLVVAVVMILVIAYMAFVGFTKAAPNVGEQKDPTGQKRDPVAYAVFDIHCSVSHPLFVGWIGGIKSLTIQSYPWVSGTPTINQVVHYDPLGFLSSDFTGYLTIRITGPNNYIPVLYTSPDQKVKVDNLVSSLTDVHFGPYTAKFWDAGTYSITVGFYSTDDKQIATKTQTFSISGGI